MGKGKIGAIVQARIGSTRLPKKSAVVLHGKPVLQHVLERVKEAKECSAVVAAIPDSRENDVLAEIAEKSGAVVFRGSENNVLERTIKAAEEFGVGQIVRVAADSPLIEGKFIDLAVRQHLGEGNDYTSSVGVLPEGIDFEVVSLEALKRLQAKSKEKRDLEHVTLYIRENRGRFKKGLLKEGKEFYRKGLKLTLDEEKDLEVLQKLPKALGKGFESIIARDVVELFDKKPELFKNSLQAKKPLVSVLMNTRNYGGTLRRALDSALGQTLGKDKYEVLVVDDGSTDNSWEIIASYGKKIDALWQMNRGAYAANNRNFRRAGGKYVTKLDADDWLEPGLLEKMVDALEKDREAGFAYCDIWHVTDGGRKKVSLKKFDVFRTIAGGILFRKDKIVEAQGTEKMYNEKLFFCEYDLHIKLVKKFKGVYVPGTHYNYFRHGKSLTANMEEVRRGLRELEKLHNVRPPKEMRELLIVN